MDKQIYRQILLMVNQKDTYKMMQGSIKELKRFQTLRDEVVKGAE